MFQTKNAYYIIIYLNTFIYYRLIRDSFNYLNYRDWLGGTSVPHFASILDGWNEKQLKNLKTYISIISNGHSRSFYLSNKQAINWKKKASMVLTKWLGQNSFHGWSSPTVVLYFIKHVPRSAVTRHTCTPLYPLAALWGPLHLERCCQVIRNNWRERSARASRSPADSL